jgi:RNA polymerase sigma-70 factor (ECF subfamily)
MSAEERRVYRDAFTAALATLTPRERNLLRQHYLHGATVDELGALYNVHRATPARWIAQIRETLLHRTRELVGAALSLTGTELDGAMTKLAGELDYSLRHTLSNEH